ncbi:MAG: AAA family ATPase [Myxococcota bacterium]
MGLAIELETIHVRGYRSARDVHLELGRLNVLVGPNGCGKTNLYRALRLLADAAEGRLARSIAEEGGMASVLFAGARRRGERARLSVSAAGDGVGFELVCGPPPPQGGYPDADGHVRGSAFALDPEVKEERIWADDGGGKAVVMAERRARSAWLRDEGGRRLEYPVALDAWESMLGQVRDPHRYPELARWRDVLRSWRFYHLFRTDPEAPLRHPQIGVRTMALGHTGDDLAAALQTVFEIGDGRALHRAVEAAFPGARLEIETTEDHRFRVQLRTPGMRRPFAAHELSDGTLRFLCLLAALTSPRPPGLLAFNEPETSLHPELLAPLAALLVAAAERSQLWITTHSHQLAEAIERRSGVAPLRLELKSGETRLARRP